MNTERPQTPTQTMRPDGSDYVLAKGLRSPSSSSDIVSSSGRSLMGGPLPPANPSPAYIAQSAAEHLTSSELDRPVTVSENALDLVNGFLDQLLYNLLHLAKSTDLEALHHAVPKLLKPRLGQAAINAADEEIRDYIKDEDPESLQGPPRLAKPSDFDLELAWKLARLRCMVYARLGDMEEEDEDEYLDSERLEEHAQGSPMSIVPMSAIFLTSVLEFLGEQALCNAAQHAEKRHNLRISKKASENDAVNQASEEVVVDSADMLQLGREGPLSRLWRSWRRDTRAPESFASRPNTPGNIMSPSMAEASHSRKTSHASHINKIPEEDSPDSAPTTPSRIPLPMRDRDIDEIEVPGLAPDYDNLDDDQATPRPEIGAKRPSSMLIMPGNFPSSAGPASPTTPTSPTVPQRSALRPQFYRQRSQSVPLPPPFAIRRPQEPGEPATPVAELADTPAAEKGAIDDVEQETFSDQPISREPAQTSRPATQHSSRASAVNGAAVAAIAGALGVEAARASRKNRDQPNTSRPQTPRNRTAAEEMMGSSYPTQGPRGDAETRASITRPGDFESLHVPSSGNVDVDDPEALALSSDDEDHARQNPRDSGFAVAGAPSESAQMPASPSSPRRNREAAVYENSIVSSPREDASEFARAHDDHRPRTQESVTFHPSALADTSHTEDEFTDDTTDLPIHQPEEPARATPWTSSIPPRMSSREPRYGHSAKSSQYSHHSKSSSSSSKLLGFTRDQSGRPLKEKRADFGDGSKALHSRDGSASTSQVISGAALGAAAAEPIAARRDHLRLRPDSEDDAARTRSLEILIKSDETLHYTLTPESARAEEVRVKDSFTTPADVHQFPRSPQKSKTETQDLADFFRNTAPPGEMSTPSPDTPRSAKAAMNGLRSNPVQYGTASTAVAAKPIAVQTTEAPASPSRSRTSVEPRDPRPERNLTRDLADYVRSTGPTAEEQLPQPLGGRSSAFGVPDTTNTSTRPDGVPRAPVDSQRSSNVSSSANQSRFQARDARPTKGSETADLIDFIRQGPPRAAGDHRIDRRVAPFRTTMDSDDLQALAPPGDFTGRSSVGSTHESSATKSMQESTNSRTALLESSRQTPVRSVPPISHDVKRQVIPEQDGMPQRTRRRVRDPYAIDFSDDEEELEEEAAPPKPRNEEESLIDFLRNTAPPPGMTTQPILATGARSQDKAAVKRSASKSKLRGMLGGDSSSRNGTMATGANGAREDSPHLHQRPNGASAGAGVRKARFEARGAKTAVTSTSDLADYLKNSGPAESSQSLPNNRDPKTVRSAAPKEQAGFLKFFSRKGSVRR